MNIVFAGTPLFAIPSLNALIKTNHTLLAVYTQPDRPAGRGHKQQPSPVKQWALEHDIPVYQPPNFKTQEQIDALAALKPDLMIVIAYGLILPQSVLETPHFGCINVHASLLPRWRGASPIQQAVLHGDLESGVTIMQMDQGLDTGAMLAKTTCPIGAHDTAGDLHDRLAELAPTALCQVLEAINAHALVPEAQQNTLATYAPKINKSDAVITWSLPAIQIDRQIRAYLPWPIAYTHIGDTHMRILQARVVNTPSTQAPGTILSLSKEGALVAAGEEALLIERIQFAGGKPISVADHLNAQHALLQINKVLQ